MIFPALAISTVLGCIVLLAALLVHIEREVNRAEQEALSTCRPQISPHEEKAPIRY